MQRILLHSFCNIDVKTTREFGVEIVELEVLRKEEILPPDSSIACLDSPSERDGSRATGMFSSISLDI